MPASQVTICTFKAGFQMPFVLFAEKSIAYSVVKLSSTRTFLFFIFFPQKPRYPSFYSFVQEGRQDNDSRVDIRHALMPHEISATHSFPN